MEKKSFYPNHVLIKLINIRKKFEDNVIYENLNLEVLEGDYISIIGRSGCGKSTLLNLLGTLDTDYRGEYYFKSDNLSNSKGKKLAKFRNENIGFVFQSDNLIPNLSVTDNIMLPFLYTRSVIDMEYFSSLLKLLEIQDISKRKVNSLSGGEAQRVNILRALIMKPKVLLIDEPTGSVDKESEKKIMNMFEKLNSKGITILLVTHNEKLAFNAKRIIRVEGKDLVEVIL